MASVSSLMKNNSTSSSLYGNKNIISGLASGMDTESMIENSISGYKTKITSLQQRMTKLQWKQDAYRGLIGSMNSILNKYLSYTSNTNLLSTTFFKKAVSTIANGENAAKVNVTGKSTSSVAINGIKQMASAAQYNIDAKRLAVKAFANEKIDWSAESVEVSNVSGSISLAHGNGNNTKMITLNFGADEIFTDDPDTPVLDADGNPEKNDDGTDKVIKGKTAKEKFVDAINSKLAEKTITTNGGTKNASELIQASLDENGNIQFTEKKGNALELSSVSGDMAKVFTKNGNTMEQNKVGSTDMALSGKQMVVTKLLGETLTVNLDGNSKTFNLGDVIMRAVSADPDRPTGDPMNITTEKFAEELNKQLKKEFGDGVSVTEDGNGGLQFEISDKHSSLTVNTTTAAGNKALGLGEGGYSNTMSTSWTLEKVLGDKADKLFNLKDDEGNPTGNGVLTINGTDIVVNRNDTVQNVLDKITNSAAGVTAKYSAFTGEFSFTSKETGVAKQITMGAEGHADETGAMQAATEDNDIAMALFGDVSKAATDDDTATARYSAGQDAILNVTVNGKRMEIQRSSNTVDLDGYNVTLKGTFGYDEDGNAIKDTEAITFTTKTDSDKIVDAVKGFVNDYNALVKALHSAFRTEPLKNSKKEEYQPLTDEDKNTMSESAITAYENKAKTGLLFGDSDLASLYSKLTNAVQGSGGMGAALRSIGIKVGYEKEGGLTTIDLDEDALRSALETDPDKVINAFTQTTSSGASVNGMMVNVRSVLEQYGKTSIGDPGILVKKAGTTLSSYSLNNNELNDQIDSLNEQIEKWQDKMSSKIDYYTNQFTQLELLINQMNSQSSMLAGLSGGY